MHRRTALKILSGLALLPSVRGVEAFAKSAPPAGRQIGINLAGLSYWGNEQPFSNLSMAASPWRMQPETAPFSWTYPLPPMTAEKYPLSVPRGSYLETFLIHTPHRDHLPVDLVVQYDGDGRLDYTGAAVTKRRRGEDVIRDLRQGGAISARLVATDARDPLRNLRLYPKNAVPQASETFRQPFLDRWKPMSALRFMDWMDTNNSKIVSWSDRPAYARFGQSEGGVALEYMVELANTLRIAPWFTLPHRADDDHVRRFAEQVRRDLDPALPVYVEYSNEVWNGMFEQAAYARQEGLRRNLSVHDFEAQLRFYAQRSSEVIDIWEKAFGSDKDRVLGVYASQAGIGWASETILSWGNARKHADVLAVAPYFGGSIGSPEQAAAVSRWTLDELFEALDADIDGANKVMIETQASIAKTFGVGLVAYEGGQHLAGHSGVENNEKIDQLFRSANRDRRMAGLYRKHLNNWWAAGGQTYVLYNSMGSYSKWGSWGLLETESSAADSPKWETVRTFLEG